MPIFWTVLIISGCWILWKVFSASIEIIKWFLSFNLLIWMQFVNMHQLIELCILKNPCIPGINPTWSWYMSFLMCCWILFFFFCWILFAKILLKIFASKFISDIGLCFSFFVLSLVLVSGWWCRCIISLEVSLHQQFFERVLEG